MFLEQGIKKENPFWKYIVGSIVVIIASFIGQIPFTIAVFAKTFSSGKMPSNTNDVLKVLEPNLSLFLMLISFAFALFALFLIVRKFHNQTIVSVTTSRENIDWNRILFAFGFWAIFSALTVYLAYYFEPNDYVLNFKPIPFLILAVIGIALIPIQTSTEEYIFRGYLMQGFAGLAKNRWFPLIMTSIIFGGMHYFNPEVDKMGNIVMIYYIGTGLFLGIITLMDEGMELALGFHAANNLITALLVTSDWSALQTHSVLKDVSNPSAGFEVLIPVFVLFPILLLIFSKKYGWTNWQEKLTGEVKENSNLNTIQND